MPPPPGLFFEVGILPDIPAEGYEKAAAGSLKKGSLGSAEEQKSGVDLILHFFPLFLTSALLNFAGFMPAGERRRSLLSLAGGGL